MGPLAPRAVAAGPTWLSGSTIISTDQTWGPEGSPYIIDGTVQVSTGATLTILPGTVVKFFPTSERSSGATSVNVGRLSLHGGRLVAQGSAGSPVVFTSYHADSAGGDSNGGGRAPARGDYSGLYFGAPSVAAAAEMPVSVLDNVAVRWGGDGGSAGCSYGSAIDVAQLGRLHVTRSEVTGAYAAGFSASGLSPGLGTAVVSQTRFAESGCGAYVGSGGGDLVSSRFEASLGKAFTLNTTNGVHVYGNEVAAPSDIAGIGGMTRESADVRGNAFLGAVGDPPGSTQDHDDLAWNWWGPDPSRLVGCWDSSEDYHPRILPGYIPPGCSGPLPSHRARYWTRVEPMLAQSPAFPENGLGASPAPPIGVLLAQTFGAGASEFAYNPSGQQADPVNSATGSFVTSQTDAAVPAPGIGVVVGRTYNSADPSVGVLGRGWSFGYHERIEVVPAQGDQPAAAVLHAGDGQQVRFQAQVEGGYLGDPGATSTLRRDGEDRWILTTRARVVRVFTPGGRLVSVTDRHGNTLGLSYDGQGRLTRAGNGTRGVWFSHDGDSNRIAQATLPDGRTVGYGYTGGLLTSVRDLAGRVTRYGYTTDDKLRTVTAPGEVETMRLAYHPGTGRVSDQWDARGRRTTFGWDPATGTATMTDPRGGVWVDRYRDHILTSRTTPGGATTSYSYDARLQLIGLEAPRGARSTFGYNAAGDVIGFSGPQGTFTTSYDEEHRPVASVNTRGVRVDYRYAGDLVGIDRPDPADPDGVSTTGYIYTPAGLLSSRTDPAGQTTTYGYSSDGDLTTVRTPAGRETSFTYDTVGRVTSTVDPRGHQPGADPDRWRTRYSYTSGDQPETTTTPLGHTTRWDYDNRGRLQQVTDAKGRVTRYTYDDADHVTSIDGPDPGIDAERYGYDDNGKLATLTDPAGRTITYSYDPANRPTRAATPLGTYTYDYDKAGNLAKVVDPANKTTLMVYDAANRLTTIDYPTGTSDVSLRYDASGNRASMVDGAGTTSYRYDTLDRLTAVTRNGKQFGYSYDDAGGIDQITYPDGAAYTYQNTPDGQIASLTHQGATLASYSYDPAGLPATLTRGDGTRSVYTHDADGRLTTLTDTRLDDGSTLLEETYAYDAVGNLTGVTDGTGAVTTHSYDTEDRLTGTCYDTTDCATATDYLEWSYDAVGNRTRETRPDGTTTSTYDPASGLLTATEGPAGSTGYAYDPLGQLRTVTAPGKTTTHTYTAAGRVAATAVTASGATTSSSYTYDGEGRRVTATTGGTRTDYAWQPLNYQLATETTGGTLIRRHAYGAGPLGAATSSSGPLSYYHQDRQGSLRVLTDSTGQRLTSYRWEPYGVLKTKTEHVPGTPASPYGWAGQHADPTGLVHLRARQYDPATGRFTTPDPAGAMGVSATFVYGAANPLTYADPYGLWPDGSDIWNAAVGLAHTLAPIAGGLALIPGPTMPIFGAVAATGGAITAIDAGYHAYNTCTGDQKGSCNAAIATTALNSAMAFPGLGWGRGLANAANAVDDVAAASNKIYSNRALQRMANEPGPYHNFPGSFDETVFSQGTRTVAPNYFNKAKPNLGNDSIQYRLPGELNGRAGVYEIFTRPSVSARTELIMHRFFRPY